MFRYAYFFKSTFFMVMLVLFTACGGGAIETSDAQKSLATIANYSQDTSKIPTVEDYHNIGIAVITPQNLDDINFLIRSLTYDEVNTESEILELVQQREEALSLITAYASSHGNSAAPTVDTYRAIGVIGVNSENINAINALIAALQNEAVDTGIEADAIVRGDTPPIDVTPGVHNLYVTTHGSDSNDGESEATAWRTITYAASQVVPGDRVLIKAGNYGAEHIEIETDGNATDPIIFEGYREVPGDVVMSPFLLGDELNASRMPLLDGGDRSSGGAFTIVNHAYVTLKNIQITRNEMGVYVYGSHHLVIENMIMMTLGALGGEGGYVYSGVGLGLSRVNDSNLSDVTIINANAEGVALDGNYNILRRIRVYSDETNESIGADGTDYYIVVKGDYNRIEESYIERIVPDVVYDDPTYPHVGHGIGFKDASQHNVVENCIAKNTEANFYVRFGNVQNNTFKNCKAYGAGFTYEHYTNHGSVGFAIRNGAQNNLFDSCLSDGNTHGVSFFRNGPEEPWDDSPYAGKENLFVNTLFLNTQSSVIDMNPYSNSEEDANASVLDNQFVNCTIHNAPYLISARRPNSGNSMTNTIVSNVTTLKNPNSTHTIDFGYRHSDFHHGFTMPAGIGNINGNPHFVDSNASNFHLQSASVAIDSGESSISEADHDREGISRPQGGGWDMGVYEYVEE